MPSAARRDAELLLSSGGVMAQVEPPEKTKLAGRHAPCCHAVVVISHRVQSVNVAG
jgi:hypothetical protein